MCSKIIITKKDKQSDWYKDNIEEPVRGIVKLLRDNGFNTQSSCGHSMTVQCEFLPDGPINRLHNLLFNNGFRNYMIITCVEVIDGHQYPWIRINFNQTIDQAMKIKRYVIPPRKVVTEK